MADPSAASEPRVCVCLSVCVCVLLRETVGARPKLDQQRGGIGRLCRSIFDDETIRGSDEVDDQTTYDERGVEWLLEWAVESSQVAKLSARPLFFESANLASRRASFRRSR